MSLLSLVTGVLKLANLLIGMARDRQLLNAGAQAEIGRQVVEITRRAGIADQVRAEIAVMSDDDLNAELRGD